MQGRGEWEGALNVNGGGGGGRELYRDAGGGGELPMSFGRLLGHWHFLLSLRTSNDFYFLCYTLLTLYYYTLCYKSMDWSFSDGAQLRLAKQPA